jgi:hypothetical protein
MTNLVSKHLSQTLHLGLLVKEESSTSARPWKFFVVRSWLVGQEVGLLGRLRCGFGVLIEAQVPRNHGDLRFLRPVAVELRERARELLWSVGAVGFLDCWRPWLLLAQIRFPSS